MKIAIVVPMFPPKYIGGTEIAAYSIAKNLSKRHEVHVITRKQPEKLESGFKTHFVRCFPAPTFLRTISTSVGFFLKIAKIRPDVIYAETLYSGALGGVLAKKLLGIPVISRPVGEIYVASRFEKMTVLKFVIRNSSMVLAMTKHMEKEVLKYGKVKTAVMPDGVDYEYFRNYPKQKKIKNSVLFVGRLIKLKGVYDLLKAFEQVKKSVPDAVLFIAGYGEEEGGMKKMIRERGINDVIFLGKINKKGVARYMKSCEVLVLPSYSEGFPLVLVEAMACGMPIVTTNARGLPEIIKNGLNGLIVNVGNYDDLAAKCKSFLTDDRLRLNVSKRNTIDSEKYSWKQITLVLERFLLSLPH